MDIIKLICFVNPKGVLKTNWEIPVSLLNGKTEIDIQIPNFKYDLPRLVDIPVPLSSQAIKIEVSNVSALFGGYPLKTELIEDFEGNGFLRIFLDKLVDGKDKNLLLDLYFNNIVNNDYVYYVVVFPIINPFESAIFNIDFKARFSFKIRTYKFREWYFNKKTSSPLIKKNVFKKNKESDLISLSCKNLLLSKNEELNIHLTGTRLPFMLRRDYFWIIIFTFFMIIVLSPIWTAFIDNDECNCKCKKEIKVSQE